MTVALRLNAEQLFRLREGLAHQNLETVREALASAVEPTAVSLLAEEAEAAEVRRPLTLEDFDRLADELADAFAKSAPSGYQPLSDYALSREGIYEDHL